MFTKKILIFLLLLLIGCADGKHPELKGSFDVIQSVSFPMSALSRPGSCGVRRKTSGNQ